MNQQIIPIPAGHVASFRVVNSQVIIDFIAKSILLDSFVNVGEVFELGGESYRVTVNEKCGKDSCLGCDLRKEIALCNNAPACFASKRQDKMNVIFIKI